MATTVPMTLAEFAALPDAPGKRELLKGKLISAAPPKVRHAMIQQRVAAMLSAYARSHGGGQVFANAGFEMPDDTCLEPDVAFVRDVQLAQAKPDEWFRGSPALAVEILSPANTASEIEDRVRSYLDGGAEAVWVINPKRHRLTAYYRAGRFDSIELPDGQIANDRLFPGLRVPLASLFAGLE